MKSASTTQAPVTRLAQHVNAPRSDVFRACVDPKLLVQWRAPEGMTAEVHELEPREGGRIRMTLRYAAGTGGGKSEADADSYTGTFVVFVPNERIAELITFDSDDANFAGEMTMTTDFRDARDGGTDVTVSFDRLPPGVKPEDNDEGTRSSLQKLAGLFDRP